MLPGIEFWLSTLLPIGIWAFLFTVLSVVAAWCKPQVAGSSKTRYVRVGAITNLRLHFATIQRNEVVNESIKPGEEALDVTAEEWNALEGGRKAMVFRHFNTWRVANDDDERHITVYEDELDSSAKFSLDFVWDSPPGHFDKGVALLKAKMEGARRRRPRQFGLR